MALIEGNHGLFDSIDPEGGGSSARLAHILGAPVILVVPALKATRSLAPLIQGFMQFEPEINIAGVIFNRVAGQRHEERIKEIMKLYCDVPVLGYIYRTKESFITQRYLGLIPEEETDQAQEIITSLGKMIEESIDLDQLIEIAQKAPPLEGLNNSTLSPAAAPKAGNCTIAIARDRAFHFYYRENLEALERHGAKLVEFSPIDDPGLPPEADAVYLGGGFPELFAKELSQNRSMLRSIREAVDAKMPIYAECGGMIYLSRSIKTDTGEVFPLVDALQGNIEMSKKPHGRGYIIFRTCETPASLETPWKIPANQEVRAHEFHYSAFAGKVDPDELVYQLKRGEGISQKKDGWLQGSIFASYAHLHSLAAPWWAKLFCEAALNYRQKQK